MARLEYHKSAANVNTDRAVPAPARSPRTARNGSVPRGSKLPLYQDPEDVHSDQRTVTLRIEKQAPRLPRRVPETFDFPPVRGR